MASRPARFTTVNDRVRGVRGRGTPGFHPRIVPLSVANRNTAGPESAPWCTTKSLLPLKTVPVGAPPTSTTSGILAPVPS